MNEDWLAIRIAEALRAIRAKLLPSGTLRDNLASAALRYLLVQRSQKTRLQRIDPKPNCITLPGWTIPPLRSNGRVLVLKLDHIGDLVLTLPALHVLRHGLADAHITLICGSWNSEFARMSGLVDEVVSFDFFEPRSSLQLVPPDRRSLMDAFSVIASGLGKFDLAIDFRHEPDTRSLLTLVNAAVRGGFSAYGNTRDALDISLANTEQIASGLGNGRPMHGQTRMSMLAHVVVDAVRPLNSTLTALVPPDSKPFLPEDYAVIAPGAGATLREWPLDRVTQLADILVHRHGLKIIILGGAREQAMALSIATTLPAEAVYDLTGQVEMANTPAILAFARLFVGMDSGLSHLAAGLGVPSVCVFSGVSRPEVWRPNGINMRVVMGQAACAPCYLARPDQCPHQQACLKVIEVADVVSACEAQLALRPQPIRRGGISRVSTETSTISANNTSRMACSLNR